MMAGNLICLATFLLQFAIFPKILVLGLLVKIPVLHFQVFSPAFLLSQIIFTKYFCRQDIFLTSKSSSLKADKIDEKVNEVDENG